MLTNSFKKQERLTGKKNFEKLLVKGQRFQVFPFTVYWHCVTNQERPVKIAISVPKRKFKKATERNLIKRRTRESYRTNKHELNTFLESKNLQLHVLVVYSSTEIPEFNKLNQIVIEILNNLIQVLSKD